MFHALPLLSAAALAASGQAASPAPTSESPAHVEAVVHEGVAYRVAYHPVVTTRARTVGAAAGARPAQQWCRHTTEIGLERRIALDDGGAASDAPLTQRVAGQRRITSQVAGACEHHRGGLARIAARDAARVEAEVRALAAADRPALLAALGSLRRFATY